jgi:hypothetical protein
MFMTRILGYRRLILGGLLPFLAAMLLHVPARADVQDTQPQGTNVKWSVKDDVIVINYDLKTDPDLKFRVDIVMKRETDAEFAAEPVTVEGDIGDGYFAGTNREIRWYYRRDYPQGFEGEGYYFEIQVRPIGKESKWMYYTVGAAAILGGVVAFLVSKNQDELPPGGIPLPPGRP